MPELGTSGSAGGPGWVTTQVYPTTAVGEGQDGGAATDHFRDRASDI